MVVNKRAEELKIRLNRALKNGKAIIIVAEDIKWLEVRTTPRSFKFNRGIKCL